MKLSLFIIVFSWSYILNWACYDIDFIGIETFGFDDSVIEKLAAADSYAEENFWAVRL